MPEPSSDCIGCKIVRWSELRPTLAASLEASLDAIFFASSATQSFTDAAARAAFRERWLGRYLAHDPDWLYVALAQSGELLGYLAGCLDDPSRQPRFADIPYFAAIADITASYPAHLHINLAPAARSHGLGSRLIARFAGDAAQAGSPGVHVVTGRGMRNVGFYLRNGFAEVRAITSGERTLLVLARRLAMPGPPHRQH
jgi:GNAT superfamily N-acetyltransferase